MILREDGSRQDYLFEMWQRIFHDTVPYTQFYFNEVYGKNEILLETDQDQIRGMLHLNPYRLHLAGHSVDAHYIVGVSTEEEYRRQGVMRNLLKETFTTLRDRGEAFTYLMPADEAYYLPFDFRFGMTQYEQELEPGIWQVEEKGYTFERAAMEEDLVSFVLLENEWKRSRYAMATEIDEAYLERLNEEVKSEFGCFFYAKKDGKPIGRFVVYAEDDFLAISQMVCYEDPLREEFLQQMIQFCDQRYHFRCYRITYAEDWKDNLLSSGQFGNIHVFQTRKKPIIMFRILDLCKMAFCLSVSQEVNCYLKVLDSQIPKQEGIYHFFGDEKALTIEKMNQDGEVTVDGTVEIGHLTARIFGNLAMDADSEETTEATANVDTIDLNEAGKKFWQSLTALAPVDIPEIV